MTFSPEAFFYPRAILREEIGRFHGVLREKKIEVWSRISARLPAALPGRGGGLRDIVHGLLAYAVDEAGCAMELRIDWREAEHHGHLSVEAEYARLVPNSAALGERLKGGEGLVWKALPNGGVAMLPPLDLGPLHAPELAPATDQPVRDASFAQRHPIDILVVDDSDIGRKLTTQILRRLGYEPVQAASGPEALKRFAERPEGFGLVFMDLRMPRMDGCETVRRILEQVEAAEAPKPMVIALTAEISEKERQRCLASGMADFLTKPCRPDELTAAIRRANSRIQSRGEAAVPHQAEGAPRRRWEDAEMLSPDTVRTLRLLPGASRPTLLEEMVESLERETPETCRLIVVARKAGDGATLRDLLHRLTGNFDVIGAVQVGRLCRAASEASTRGDEAALDRLLDEIGARFEVLRRMLAKEVAA